MPQPYPEARQSFIDAKLTSVKDARKALADSVRVESELRAKLDAQEDLSRNLRLYVSELEKTSQRVRTAADEAERQQRTEQKLAKARAAKKEKAMVTKLNTAWLYPIRASVNLTPALPQVVLDAIEDKVKAGTYNDQHLQRLAMFIMSHQTTLNKLSLVKAHQVALGKAVTL